MLCSLADMAAAPRRESPQAEGALERLVRAGIRISAEREIGTVLREVVDSAREVIEARYAALGVLDASGHALSQFIVSGLSDEEYAKIGALPTGKGLLGVVIEHTRPIRLSRIKDHPKSSGFPSNHPPMRSFLGVPITGRDGVIGNLYLTDKLGAEEFSADDESVAVLLAAQAAVALDNARLYEETEHLLSEVRVMQTSRDRFFAMINHELRNALTAVFGWSDLLLRKMGSDPPRAAREVYESAERTLALVNDVLDLSRLEASRLQISVRDTDAQQLAADAISTVEPAADERAITISRDGDQGAVACHTDPQRVRQVLVNLLTNAVRHSPDGGVVTVTLRATDDALEFGVTDRGEGIAPEQLAEIFEAFHRGSSDVRGTGLGLTLSRQLARRLGGELRVRSRPGAGATFTLAVPRTLHGE